MAGELIRIAAERQMREAPRPWRRPRARWDEFCARFPFAETEDQARAIADVLEDLAAGRPMDRLICGDVGFGKTEVALRAAFVAAMSGAQVAVVVPTTLLARQHFRVFSARFAGSAGQGGAALAHGHGEGSRRGARGPGRRRASTSSSAPMRCWRNRSTFADLGLLIVDEEQHFGVAHKETAEGAEGRRACADADGHADPAHACNWR